MMLTTVFLATLMAGSAAAQPASPTEVAAEAQYGHYKGRAGVGSARCTDLLGVMATARQHGGLNSDRGLAHVSRYVHYLNGFMSAYNAAMSTVVPSPQNRPYNAFSALGEPPAVHALYAIEPWCAENPGAQFEDAILALFNRLSP